MSEFLKTTNDRCTDWDTAWEAATGVSVVDPAELKLLGAAMMRAVPDSHDASAFEAQDAA